MITCPNCRSTHENACGSRVFAKASCPVCLETREPVVALPCGHALCEPCFGRLTASGSSTATAIYDGTTWVAKTWSGAARGGDPDPYGDESTIEISGGRIRWTNGGGGGPYAIANLPATRTSPDGEAIKFSLDSDNDLVVEFGYASPATIIYKRQEGVSSYTSPESEISSRRDYEWQREEAARDREVAAGSAAAAAEYLRERAEARAAERQATVVSVDRSQIPTAVPVPPGTGGSVQAHATPAMGGSQQWRESMAVGDVIDAKDSEGRWFDSRIVAIDVGDRVKVHYNGWSSRWDCWFDRNDESIQPLFTHTDDWRRLKVGDALEMRGPFEKALWYRGFVKEVDGGRVLVSSHTPNVGEQWVETSSELICKLGSHTRPVR
jgi:hypothetical protein